jgi:putative ABC transport system permease protein
MESLIKDIGFALRTLRKNLGFTTISVLMIALGIGACASIFSIVNAVLLRPLPYADPSRLVLIWNELRARNVLDFPFSIPDVKDFRLQTKSYDGVAGFFPPGRVTIAGDDGQPEQIRNCGVTPNLFSVLGVRVQLGRDFKEEDGTPAAVPNPATPNATPPPRLPAIAILSNGFWQRRYGSDPSVIGRMVDLGGGRAEIVGVLEPGFELLFPARTGIDSNVDMWTAARLNFDTAQRNLGALRVIARLKAGVAMDKAQAEAEGVAAELRATWALKKNADLHIRLVPMQEDIVSEARPTILVLFGAVLFVLLIACSNVANLLVVHAAARHRELVIRAAIGGSRWRLIRQMLTESAILATIGGGLGLLLAQGGIDFLVAHAPAKLPRISSIGIDPVVITFTVVTAVLTIFIFGVLPAFRASRPDIVDALRVSGGSPGLRGGKLLRSAVVVTELALSFVLLVGFGLMFRSFNALQRVDPGYEATHVLSFVLQSPQLNGPNAQNQTAFLQQVNDRIAAIPNVESVSAATPLPLDGGVSLVPWATPEAGAADPSAFRQAGFHIVRPGYFETLKTRLIAGRTFTSDDNIPNTSRVVVDDLLAARAFPHGSPIGKTLLVRNLRFNGPNAPINVTVEVIGVVKHQRHESVTAEGREAIFFVEQYFGPGAAGRWIVRTKGEPDAIASAVRAAMVALDPKITLGEVQPMMAFVDKSMGPTRFAMQLIGIFAGIAGVMAAIGLYGVLSTVVRQRTAEIGMRIVFGATRPSILRLVVSEGLRLSGLGVVVGLIAALALTGWIRSILVAVTPTDPATFGVITVLFLSIAVVASWLPAIRAARLDPTVALREE